MYYLKNIFYILFITTSIYTRTASTIDNQTTCELKAKNLLNSNFEQISNNNSNEIKIINDNGKNLGPARDQDSLEMCTSFAASDIIEDFLIKKKIIQKNTDKNQISAVALALRQPSNIATTNTNKKKFLKLKTQKLSNLSNEQIENFSSIFQSIGASLETIIKSNTENLCFEDEVDSRETNLKLLLEVSCNKSERILQKKLQLSNNLQDALSFLTYIDLSNEIFTNSRYQCTTLSLINSIFKGANIKNIEDLQNAIRQNINQDDTKSTNFNLLSILTKKSCKEKILPPLPTPKRVNALGNSKIYTDKPISTDIVVNEIDIQLKKGNIPRITYSFDAAFGFKKPVPIKINHTSIITGNINICGDEYYVVRNSFGIAACNSELNNHLRRQLFEQKLYTAENALNDKCYNDAEAKSRSSFECDTLKDISKKNECIVKREQAINSLNKQCNQDFFHSYSKKLKIPFFCNSRGDYIIKKEELKKGLFISETIEK